MLNLLRQWWRWWQVRKASAAGLIPGWWDFTVDCGFSKRWARCGVCDSCRNFVPPSRSEQLNAESRIETGWYVRYCDSLGIWRL